MSWADKLTQLYPAKARKLSCICQFKIISSYYCSASDKSNYYKTIFITQLFISPGGFVGLFSMFSAYRRWCRTTSTRAQYLEKMLDMCCLIDNLDCTQAGKHRELERTEIQKSEKPFSVPSLLFTTLPIPFPC